MSDRFSRVEERLRQLDEAVSSLSRRLEALEHCEALGANLAAAAEAVDRGSVQLSRAPRSDVVALLSLGGRTCLVFGGAYLLRALTESGHLPATTGVLLGLIYAVGWLAAADRAGSTSALFHGVATILIGLPIVWEAAGRFGILSPMQGAVALAVVVALALIVAWHRHLPVLAAVTVLGGVAASFALLVSLDRVVPFATLLVGLAGATLWVAYHRGWTWLAALTGLAADLAVLAALMRTLANPPRDSSGVVLALQIALFALYFGSFAARALLRSRLGVFEYVQGSLVLAVGLGGAIALVRGDGVATASLGAATLAGAVLAYWIAFGSMTRQRASDATLYFFTSLGLVLALVGGRLLLADAPYAWALSAGAVVAVGFGRWTPSPALMLHGAVALIAAAWFSGALTLIEQVWLSSVTAWPVSAMPTWAVIASALACFLVPARRSDEGPSGIVSGVRFFLGALTVAGLGTFGVIWIGPLLTGTTPLVGSTSAVKSLVLAVSAVCVAWTRGTPEFAELSRLTYPLLAAGGLKILLDDLPASRPVTLVVTLALYGAALILAPRVLRSLRRPLKNAA